MNLTLAAPKPAPKEIVSVPVPVPDNSLEVSCIISPTAPEPGAVSKLRT